MLRKAAFSFLLVGLLVCSQGATSESPACGSSNIREVLFSRDLTKINKLTLAIECGWSPGAAKEYFANVLEVGQEIFAEPDPPPASRRVFYRLAASAAMKDAAGTDRIAQAVRQQQAVADLLMAVSPGNETAATNEWISWRAVNTRTVMMFFNNFHNHVIPGFKPLLALVNVAPPIAPPGLHISSGMDPAAIPDANARAAYECAINENQRRIKLNEAQKAYASALGRTVACEEYLVRVYSHEPVDYEELREYMYLGGFEDNIMRRVLDQVASQSGVAMPEGIGIESAAKPGKMEGKK